MAAAAAPLGAPTPVWIAVGVLGVALLGYAAASWSGGGEPEPAGDVQIASASDTGAGSVSGNIIQNSTVTVTTVAAPGGQRAKRDVLDVSPEYLTGLYAGHTDIQGAKLVTPYLGKRIKVSGRVENVAPRGLGASLTFERRSAPYVSARFEEAESVEVLRVGQEVTVVGKIGTVERYYMFLEEGELVEGD